MIAFAISLVALALFIMIYVLMNLGQIIENAFLWHKDWIKFEKQYKRKIYQLETDLEAEKREVNLLKIELDSARNKFNIRK